MELYEYTAHELAKMYRNKETTVTKVIESIYKRIEEKEPAIKAYLSLDKENALKQAEEQKEMPCMPQSQKPEAEAEVKRKWIGFNAYLSESGELLKQVAGGLRQGAGVLS